MNIVDRIVSPNIWDEEWEVGTIDLTTGRNGVFNDYFRSKNYIAVESNQIYYLKAYNNYLLYIFSYDENYNYLDYYTIYANRTITIGSTTKYIRFVNVSTNTYKHDICINKSNPSINGKYFPYVMYKRYDIVDKPTYELPDGYIPTDIEVGGSYGVVDLGTLNWAYASSYGFLSTDLRNLAKKISNAYIVANIFCGIYETTTYYNVANKTKDMQIALGGYTTDAVLLVNNNSYTDATTFKNAMSGIYLIYERANPSSPTLVRGNDLNKFCIYNGQIGVYGDTFRYNSNIPLKQWLRKLKIGG